MADSSTLSIPGARAPAPTAALHDALRRAIAQVNTVLVGKPERVNLAFTCLIAGGHLLIEDLPGVGKTTLAHALAVTLGLDFSRVQFTSDLMPADIIGVSIYERERDGNHEGRFRFHPGPLFTQLLLADEINRGTPKTQSALLEAMAEQQVSIDATTHALPDPFFVIATQNPLDFAGTYPLPDSQLDRFMLRMSLGYPDPAAERAMLAASDRRAYLETLPAQLHADQILALRRRAREITTAPALIDYVQRLLAASRSHARIRVGLSPRAGLALLAAARATALLHGRDHCLPEDVQAVFAAVAGHRLASEGSPSERGALADELVRATPVR